MSTIKDFILGKEKFNADEEIQIGVDNDDPFKNKKKQKEFSVPSKSGVATSAGTTSAEKVQMEI